MDETEQAEGRAVWQHAQAAIERAFEAFGHDKDRTENAALYLEAIAATQQATQWVREHPGYVHDRQDGLLIEGAMAGLARAARIERMQQASHSLAQDHKARNRGDIPWVDTIDQLTPAEHRAFEREQRITRMQQVTQDAAQRGPRHETQEHHISYGR